MRVSVVCEEKQYRSLGKCIYCLRAEDGSEDRRLTDEHIITDALSGRSIFKRASCQTCNNYINKTFEQPALKTSLLLPRLILELKSRKSKKRKTPPKKLPKVSLASWDETLDSNRVYNEELELENFPPVISLMKFEPAGILIDKLKGGGLEKIEVLFVNLPLSWKPLHTHVTVREEANFTAFGLSLAKAAYCQAVALHGLEGFDGQDMRDLILGKRDDLFNFVGGPLRKENLSKAYLRSLYERPEGEYCTILVHLFASFVSSPYQVVVGKYVRG